MNATVKIMDWSKFTVDEWIKQYAAFMSINRMKGGHLPSALEVNQIYWLIRENDKTGRSSNGKYVYLQIGQYEYDQIDALIKSVLNSKSIIPSARECVQLYLKQYIEGLTEVQMADLFVYAKSKIRERVVCGRFYLLGHDKRLTH